MIDIHCHLLPALDDGAADLAETREMLRLAAADGVTDMVLTPHLRHYRWPDLDRARIQARFDQLSADVAAPPRLALGAEVRVDSEVFAELDACGRGALLTLAGSRYLLVEFEAFPVGPEPEDVVVELGVAGFTPVLAHPERLPWLAEEPERLASLADLGALFQVTAMSVTGEFGRRAQACCRWLLDNDLLHFVASDAHDPERRPPLLAAARDFVASGWGAATARRLLEDNPRAVLEDRDIAAAETVREAAR